MMLMLLMMLFMMMLIMNPGIREALKTYADPVLSPIVPADSLILIRFGSTRAIIAGAVLPQLRRVWGLSSPEASLLTLRWVGR